jgi:hypothetical protein
VYLDGRQVASKAVNKKRKAGTTPLRIGARQDGFRYGFFAGLIDEVRLYNRALSPDDVKRSCDALASGRPAASEMKVREKGLVARWSFDEPVKIDVAVQRIMDRAGPKPARYQPH